MGSWRRVIVISRHAVLVAGFRTLIGEAANLNVVECADLSQLPEILSQGHAESPDLLLIDVATVVNLHSVAEMKAQSAGSSVILWADWISPEFVREALQSGIKGVLRKDAPPALYLECVRQVSAGQLWLEGELNQKLLSGKAVKLSPRERQLIHLLTEGLRNKEIAGRMNITEGTTKAYLSRLFEKTGASDRFELAMFALKNLEFNPSEGPSRGPRIFLPLRSVFSRR